MPEAATQLSEIEQRHSDASIAEEIRVFAERVGQWQRGEITDDQLRPFRLKHGIYGQRQPGVQMVRVKIPSGVLTPTQLRALADVADTYSTGRGHLTTRENIQFHFVKMENLPEVMRRIAAAGLTTREACGNTVRNVTSCALAGICAGESFDVTPYALGVTRFLLRHPEFHDLPRKFKIAFSGCEDDGNCAVAGIHDIGLIARVRVNGSAARGFKVLVGGGLGSLPTEAATLYDFLPEDELLPTIEAVLRVFNEHGNRKNKYKARLKFVLRDKGIAELRRLVEEKRKTITTPAEVFTVASPVAQPLVTIGAPPAAEPQDDEYLRWRESNVMPQRQPGHSALWVKVAAGGVTSAQLRGLASVLDKHRLPGARVAILQNFVVPWVRNEQIASVYADLHALALATPGARTIADVTGCPGATTCNLGITRSLTLAEELSSLLATENDPQIRKLRIKISGCPNSCGQHHIADIGLYGNARKIGDQQAPFYQLLLGGHVGAEGVRFGKQTMVVAAKQVPETIRTLLELYRAARRDAESFREWLARTSEADIIRELQPVAEPPEGSADNFFDWGDLERYSLQLGRGECAT